MRAQAGMLAMARPVPLLLLSALLLLGTSLSSSQEITIPKGDLAGPTPFVGAYYFNWYNIEDQWKRYSQTRHPVLGHYDQSDPAVLVKHHAWAKQGGIDFFAMAWSGGGSDLINWERADEIDRRVTSHLKMTDGVQVALMYNIRDFVQAGSHGKIDLSEENYCAIISDHLVYAAQKHFPEENYFKVGENPVIFLYTLRDYVNYVDCLKLALERMLLETGYVPYIIGDSVWWSPSPEKFDWKDYHSINVSAVTAFSTFDAGQPHRMGHNFAWDNSQLFHDMIKPAWAEQMIVIPSIMPGFDDRHMRGRDRPTIDRAHGAELVQQWKQVLWYPMCQTKILGLMKRMQRNILGFQFNVRPRTKKGRESMEAKGSALLTPPMIMINSFNEWHDGTEIEPSTEEGENMLHLIAQLKHEVKNEEMFCGKEKDKNFRAPKFITPKLFNENSRTPADEMFVRGMSVLMWFFLMWMIWMFGGQMLLHYTGRAPNKYKDDDLGAFGSKRGNSGGMFADFAPKCIPTEVFMNGAKYPKRVPTVMTLAALAATGFVCFLLVTLFFGHTPVVGWFEDRAHEWERRGHSNVRRAREIAHKLCPQLVLNLHKAKFEDWVRKLAANQISQLEFRDEMCGDKALHTREIEAIYLELLGREPEPKGLEHYEKAVEEGRMHLDDVRLAIQNSPESTDYQQMRQAYKTKISKFMVAPFGVLKNAIETVKRKEKKERAEILASLDLVQAKVQEYINAGETDKANELLADYKNANSARVALKGPRKMGKEEGSRHDTMMDDWDVA